MSKQTIFIAILSLVSWSATNLVTPSFAQTNDNAAVQKQKIEELTRKFQEKSEKATSGMKGWTCRNMPNGGHRMTVLDPTGTHAMNGIPSSEAGFRDDHSIPTEKLPPCDNELIGTFGR